MRSVENLRSRRLSETEHAGRWVSRARGKPNATKPRPTRHAPQLRRIFMNFHHGIDRMGARGWRFLYLGAASLMVLLTASALTKAAGAQGDTVQHNWGQNDAERYDGEMCRRAPAPVRLAAEAE